MAENVLGSIWSAAAWRLANYGQLAREALFYALRRNRPHVDVAGIRLSLQSDIITPRVFYYMHKEYEQAERILLDRYIERTDRILEIGGGMGFLAAFALKEKGIRDYALVEGNPELEPLIRKNFTLNGLSFDKIVFINEIVNDVRTEVRFNVTKQFWASNIDDRYQTVSVLTRKAVSTAALLDRLPFSPTFLILDIEGAEREIEFSNLKGISKILIELHPAMIGAAETATVITRIIRQGFSLVDFIGTGYYFQRSA